MIKETLVVFLIGVFELMFIRTDRSIVSDIPLKTFRVVPVLADPDGEQPRNVRIIFWIKDEMFLI